MEFLHHKLVTSVKKLWIFHSSYPGKGCTKLYFYHVFSGSFYCLKFMDFWIVYSLISRYNSINVQDLRNYKTWWSDFPDNSLTSRRTHYMLNCCIKYKFLILALRKESLKMLYFPSETKSINSWVSSKEAINVPWPDFFIPSRPGYILLKNIFKHT